MLWLLLSVMLMGVAYATPLSFISLSFEDACKATPGIGYNTEEIAETNKWRFAQKIYDSLCNVSRYEHPIIPKTIHQIWLGASVPEQCRVFLKSWKKYHPAWTFKLWTEKEIDALGLINKAAYQRATNYGEKSDIARYEILYRFGGLYIDTDFECLRPLDELHETVSFYAGIAMDKDLVLFNGLIGAAPGHPFLKKCIESIPRYQTDRVPWRIMHRTGPYFFTLCVFESLHLEQRPIALLPPLFFYSWPYFSETIPPHKYATNHSYAIHYWHGSWMP